LCKRIQPDLVSRNFDVLIQEFERGASCGERFPIH
jgi:hypothetical protein